MHTNNFEIGNQVNGRIEQPEHYSIEYAGPRESRANANPLSFWRSLATGTCLSLAMLALGPATAWSATHERLSLDVLGAEANGDSSHAIISADRQYVSFWSDADNLVDGDTNGVQDVFVRERTTGTVERISVDSNGNESNADSFGHGISHDGRYVVFFTAADNLVAGDTNGTFDVFVHDRITGITERVSVDSDGNEANGISTNHKISGDGRYVVFQSTATNLVAGDTNATSDVFVHDRTTGATERVSVDSLGAEADADTTQPGIGHDGRYVVFQSTATNLVAGDTNGASDVFVHDRTTGATRRVSVDSAGNEANGGSVHALIDHEGEYVVFQSRATNLAAGDANTLWDVYIYDLLTGAIELVSVDAYGNVGNDDSHAHHDTLAGNGRYVLFISDATNLVDGDINGVPDVFIRDRFAGTTERLSEDDDGNGADGISDEPTISHDGRYVVFESASTNLVTGDTNGVSDVFLVAGPVAAPAAAGAAGAGGCSASMAPTTWGDAAGTLLMLFAPLLWVMARRRDNRVKVQG